MYFYFTDRKFNLLGIASDDRRTKIRMTGVKDSLSIKRATRLFDGNIEFNRSSANTVKDMAMAGNYILYRDSRGKNVWLTIMEFEHNPAKGAHYFSAEDAGMDLINETVPAYKADKAYPIAYYINKFTADSGFEIGINEISDLTRTLTWESESSTSLARIISVATQFDNAELDFSFEIEGLEVTRKLINIYKKRGSDKRVTLNVDYDINNIITKGNIYNLFTSAYATGGTPQGKDEPINLKGYKYTDPSGRFVLGTDGVMRDTVAVRKWSRLLSKDNPNPKSSHIQRVLSFETTSQKVLCDTVVRQLEQNSEIYFDYEVDLAKLPDNTEIGDTIYLADEFGELYLSARVLEINQEYSSRKYTAVLGDYVIQDSGISSELQDLANKLQNSVPYIWTRYADDDQGTGMTAEPAGKSYMANKTVKGIETPSDDPEDYAGLWVKIKGDDGEAGQTPVVHSAWSWSPDGTDRFTTEYPGENLIVLSQLVNGTYDQTTGLPTSGPDLKRNTVPVILESGASYVVSNSKPTKSMRFFFYDADGRYISNYNTSSAVHKIIIPSNATKMNYVLWAASLTDGSYVYWKLEKGDTPTIYTPAPSEDYTNAYPLYEGSYTDYSDIASTNPSDYTWRRIKGEDGQSPYDVDIISANGLLFKNGVIQTTLTAVVYRGEDNVTEQLDANQFRWTKINADGSLDKTWNTIHAGGTKSITVTSEDIYRRATFNCDIVEI